MNIIKELKKRLKWEILAIYYGGSKAYGLEDDSGDTDYMVIVDGPIRFEKVDFDEENAECFIIGKEEFIKVQEIEKETYGPITAHADNVLGILIWNNLVYLNPIYEADFIEIVNADWNKKLVKFLDYFVSYYRMTISPIANYKKHYHVYRLNYILKHHEKSGVFSLKLTEDERKEVLHFKKHYKALPNKASEVSLLLDEIERYKSKLEERR